MKDVDKNISSVKNELERLYSLATTPNISKFDFLHVLDNYVNFFQNEKILQKVIFTMKEDGAKESIQVIQNSVHDRYALSLHEFESQEGLGDTYPISECEQLIEFSEEFEKVKNLKTEAEVSNTKIIVEFETPTGKGTKHSSGGSLFVMIDIYNKQLKSLHEFFIKQLDLIKAHGVFSKYLDYSEKDGVLYFQEKQIKINIKKILSNAHYLLIYLFDHNPFEKHFCDELDDNKAILEKRHWKSYYDACVDIQKKVEKETGISDFLDFNSGQGMYVRLNPKYSLNEIV